VRVSEAVETPRRCKIGVDIGGTFTDLVSLDTDTGAARVVKTFTTPDDPARGFIEGVDRSGVPLREVEAFITHGSTTALNTVLTRTGARVGFLTTRGHRDVLDIGRAFREEGHLYDASWMRPHVARPIVPRYLRRTVDERILADGSVYRPLDEVELRDVIDAFKGDGAEVIAVCFINSYVNPAHEQRARDVIHEAWPDVRVELSSELAPVPREYDRAITLALNAYVSPVVGTYLGKIGDEIRGRGYEQTLYVMQSPGGVIEADASRRVPVATMMSGPVAGVLGAQYLGEVLGIPDILTFDMGGTSTDVAAITSGTFVYAKRHQIEWDIYSVLPMIEINSVGQGGGSIAWIDSAGALRVGPQSAGAFPGPVCYGRGGEQPTITDSNLLRGLLHEDTFAGGEIRLDADASRQAVERLSEELGAEPLAVAEGIYDIANANMMEAIRGVTIYKGIDPRDYTLLCYGSAGGQHVSAIAGELGIREIAVPVMPGAFSAFGLICSDLKVDLTRSVVREFDRISNDELTALFAEMEAEGIASVEAQGIDRAEVVVERFIEAHHVGQTWETVSRAPGGAIDDARRAELLEEFHATHERLWAFRSDDIPLVVVNVRVAVVGPIEKPALPRLAKGAGKPAGNAVLFEQPVHLRGDFREIPFLRRDSLRAGDTIEGPAAVVEQTSTTLLLEGDRCVVDDHGTLRIRKEAAAR
jgi:N-methylhydantoinase A